MGQAKVQKTRKQAAVAGKKKLGTSVRKPAAERDASASNAASLGSTTSRAPAARGSRSVAAAQLRGIVRPLESQHTDPQIIGPSPLPGAGAVDIDQVLASIAKSRDALIEVKKKLNAISETDLDSLPQTAQEAWADELNETDNAIVALEAAGLKAINDDFARRVPELEQRTKALAAGLQQLQDAVDIISSVGKVIEIVTDIASLIK